MLTFKLPKSIPDQYGPQTPGINNLLRDTAMWQVDVPHTSTILWHIALASISGYTYKYQIINDGS